MAGPRMLFAVGRESSASPFYHLIVTVWFLVPSWQMRLLSGRAVVPLHQPKYLASSEKCCSDSVLLSLGSLLLLRWQREVWSGRTTGTYESCPGDNTNHLSDSWLRWTETGQKYFCEVTLPHETSFVTFWRGEIKTVDFKGLHQGLTVVLQLYNPVQHVSNWRQQVCSCNPTWPHFIIVCILLWMYRHQLDFFKSWNIFFLQHVPGQQISTVILELDQTFWGSQLAPKIGQWARVRS